VAEKIENPAEETDQGHLAEEIEETAECPECGAIIREVKMGTHRFLAHDVDRRASDGANPSPDSPTPPPEKEHKSSTDERGDQEKGKPHFWFGDRYHRK